MKRIGVLALQGAVSEHISKIESVGASALEIKYADDLNKIDGLIMPGGESSAMGRLLRDFSLINPLRERILAGFPVWGTCAGMILLAKKIDGEQTVHLGVMDIVVRRNAYGRQLDSFTKNCVIPEISEDEIPLVFIRAPYAESAGENVHIIHSIGTQITACRQGNILATAFHPELTGSNAFHKYFIDMCSKEQFM